jgi:hypothetical protein
MGVRRPGWNRHDKDSARASWLSCCPGQIQAKSQLGYAPDGIRMHGALPLPVDSTV